MKCSELWFAMVSSLFDSCRFIWHVFPLPCEFQLGGVLGVPPVYFWLPEDFDVIVRTNKQNPQFIVSDSTKEFTGLSSDFKVSDLCLDLWSDWAGLHGLLLCQFSSFMSEFFPHH